MNTPIDEFFFKTAELSDIALSNYFGKMSKYRGRFFVQMKALVARKLRKKGYTFEAIAEIIFSNKDRHDTIIYYIKHYRDIDDVVDVERNYKQWIRDGVYPKSLNINTMIKDPNCLPNEVSYSRLTGTTLKLEKL